MSLHIGYLASKIRNSILIVTVHGSIEPLSTSFLSRKIIEFSLHKSSHIITVGTSVSNEIIKDYSIDRSKISLIDMGVDTELFNSMAKQEARINLGLPLEKRILICIGNLIWRKGFHILLNSIARYPPIFRSTITIIIGHGPIYDILQDYVNEKDLSDQVHFAGVVNKKQIPLWLSAADCLVHSALDEPFGLVIGEAMSCQKIVVASPVGGVKDYLEDG